MILNQGILHKIKIVELIPKYQHLTQIIQLGCQCEQENNVYRTTLVTILLEN